VWDLFPATAWPSGANFAWWGWEVGNSKSAAGIADGTGSGRADLVGLYSLASSSSLITESGFTALCHTPSGGPTCQDRALMYITSGYIFNVQGTNT